MLAAAEIIGVGVEGGVVMLNALSAASLIVAIHVAAVRRLCEPWLAVAAAGLAAVSVGLLQVVGMLWTEPPFLVAAFGAVIAMEHIVRDRGAWSHAYLWAVWATWVACALRYAGVAVVAFGVVMVLMANRDRGWFVALKDALLYGLAASALLVGLVIRNLGNGVGAFGDRVSGNETLSNLARRWVLTIGEWFIPKGRGTLVYAGLAVFVLLFVGAGITLRVIRSSTQERWGLITLLAFVVVYSAYLSLSELLIPIDPVNVRLTSPLFAPVMVLGAVAADEYRRRFPASLGGERLSLAFAVSLCAALAVLGRWSVMVAHARAVAGVGYNSRDYEDSSLIGAVSQLPVGAAIASNRPDAIYWLTGREVRMSPAATFYRSGEQRPEQLSEFIGWVQAEPSGTAFLAWFDTTISYLHEPTELRNAGIYLVELEHMEDGVLYLIELG